MLALIFRGVFLAGVVGWYSTSMWGLIDSYFKHQFQRYLDEEFQKNPKMRDAVHVQGDGGKVGAADKIEKSLADAPKQVAAVLQLLESCDLEADRECAVGAADIERTSRWENESVPLPPQSLDTSETGAAEVPDATEVIGPMQHAKDESAQEDADATLGRGTLEVVSHDKQDTSILDKFHQELHDPQDKEKLLQKPKYKEQQFFEIEKEQQQFSEIEKEQQQFSEIEKEHYLPFKEHELKQNEVPQEQSSIQQDEEIILIEKQERSEQIEKYEQQHLSRSRKQKSRQKFIRKKRIKSTKPQIGAKLEDASQRKQKREQFPILTITDEDFNAVARRKRKFKSNDGDWDENDFEQDRDFAEFDDEANREFGGKDEDAEKGIFVADLPFRPAIDIYDLEQVSGEEFCPLTLDVDPSCEETREWP